MIDFRSIILSHIMAVSCTINDLHIDPRVLTLAAESGLRFLTPKSHAEEDVCKLDGPTIPSKDVARTVC